MLLTDDGFHYDGTTPALSFTVMEPDSFLVVLDYNNNISIGIIYVNKYGGTRGIWKFDRKAET